MVSVVTLGRLEKVELRTAWPNESSNFTPWLAQPENLRLLGEALGIELELEGIEQAVETFSADILAREAVTGGKVLIENQLEQTDHGHLGQLLTYAAGLDANTIVWIARDFRDPHRAALDHLNRITGPDFNFFGVQIELYRIGDSPLAPRFNIVAKPNDWSKRLMEKATAAQSSDPSRQEWVDYWSKFFQFTVGSSLQLVNRVPPKEGWCRLSQLRSGAMSLSVWLHWSKHRLRTLLWAEGPQNKWAFDQLYSQREAIESQIGSPLTWDRMDHKKSSMIYAEKVHQEQLSEEDEFRWFRDEATLFAKTFPSFVSALEQQASIADEESL